MPPQIKKEMVDASGYSYDQAISDDQMSMGTLLACKLENREQCFSLRLAIPTVCDSVLLLIRALREREKRVRDRQRARQM